MKVVGRLFAALRALNRSLYASLTPVVGSKGQMPVPEHSVQVLEVVECRASAFQNVATVVAPEILRKVVGLPSRRHELPQSRRLGS